MARDHRYDILFQPLAIGPVTARNRFFQVPHCNGMGYRDPSMLAAMRGMKAEGGWAVVCTEMAEIHPTADVAPYVELRLWSDHDIPALARISAKVHEHGALAGIELCHSGPGAANLWSREVPMGPMAIPVFAYNHDPRPGPRHGQGRHPRSPPRPPRCGAPCEDRGFRSDLVYAGHGIGIFQLFLSRATNQRSDEYGGSLENRVRLLKEVIEDTKDAVGGSCAVPLRIAHERVLGRVGPRACGGPRRHRA